jgi:hypothetical protein
MFMQLFAVLVHLILFATAVAPLFISKLTRFLGYIILAPIVHCLIFLLVSSLDGLEDSEMRGLGVLAFLWLSILAISVGVKIVWLLVAAALKRTKSTSSSTIIEKL